MKDLILFTLKRANFKKYKKQVLWIISLSFLFQALNLVVPYITGMILDNFIQGINFKFVLFLIGVVLVTEIIANSIYVLKEKIDYDQFYYDFSRDLKREALEKLLSFSVGQHIAKSSGVKDTIITKGVDAMKTLVRNSIYLYLPTIFMTLVTLVGLFVLDVQIGMICFAFFSLLIIYQTNLLKKTYPDMIHSEKIGQEVGKTFWNVLNNILLVKNSGREAFANDMVDQEVLKETNFNKKLWSHYAVKLIGSGKFLIVGTAFVMIVAAWKISIGEITPGTFVVISMWSSMFFSQALNFQGIYRSIARSVPSIQEFKDFFEMVPDIQSPKNAIRLDSLQGNIEFRDVFFSYPDEENDDHVLENISFAINPKETIGIVGRSGSGKSSFIKLLLRNYDPTKGSILIDGNNLKKLHPSWYLQHIGYVEQATQLFDTTIRENLSFVTEEKLEEEDFRRALTQAGLLDFIEKLPNGLDTKIGEQGVKLSGGQRQRLAIARALIKKPALLILDEATASLDSEKEKEIQEAIDNLAKESISATKIIIAHRLSTIVNADRIFVFDEGRIIDIGTHQELLGRCEIYQNLYNIQHQAALI